MTFYEVLQKVPPTDIEKKQLKNFKVSGGFHCDYVPCSSCYFHRAREVIDLDRCTDLGWTERRNMLTWLNARWIQEEV